jgi:V8-like Glu-specific endopeptidase
MSHLGEGSPRRAAALAPAVVAVALLALFAALAASAAAAPLPAHGLEPAPAGFWTPARIQRALTSDSLLHTPVSAPEASASSLRVLEVAGQEDRVNGRVFGVDPREGPYSCSGTSLSTPSGSIVLTAGHCVVEDGRWGTQLIFVPAYEHELHPFGIFRATEVFTTHGWERFGNSDFDVAALRVEPGPLGTLSQVVGSVGWTSNRSRYAALQIFGYPAAALGGEELRSCVTHGLGSDELTNLLPGPPTLPAKCDMAGGSSGGAWMVEGDLVDGVTSYGYTANHDRLYSPYFGEGIARFLGRLP